MKLRTVTYLILLFGLILLGGQSAISGETLSKKLDLRVRTIMIDPWYGGEEKGPRIGETSGKDVTLELAQKVKDLLEQTEFNVYLTRNEDHFIPLDQRVFLSKSKRADIHFAIKVSKSKKNCIRIFIPSLAIKEIPKEVESRPLAELHGELDEILMNLKATSIQEESLSLAGTVRSKLKNSAILNCVELWKGKDYILENAQMPTVMVDFPVPSSSNQQRYLTEDTSLNKIAQSLSAAIKAYSEELTTTKEQAH